MGDPVSVIAIDVVAGLIDLLRRLSGRTPKEQNDIKQNLVALGTDLGIMKDIVTMIGKRNYLRNLEGVVRWMDEASSLVNDADTLLKSIEAKHSTSKKRRCNREQFHCSSGDAKRLSDLKIRYDQLAKHNDTVLELIRQHRRPFEWLFCAGCCQQA